MLNGEGQTLWRKTLSLFIFFFQNQKALASLAIVSIFCSVIVDLLQIFVGYLFFVFVFQESDPTSGSAFQPLIAIVNEQSSPLTIVFAFFVSTTFASAIVRALSTYLQTKAAYQFGVHLSQKTLAAVLDWPSEVFKSNEKADLIASTTLKINNLISGFLIPFMSALQAALIVFAAIVGAIAVFNSGTLLIVGTLFCIFGGVFFLIQKSLGKSGVIVARSYGRTISCLDETLDLHPEVRLLGVKEYFVSKFAKLNSELRNAQSLIKLLISLPKNVIEAIITVVGAFFCLFYLSDTNALISALPLIGTFALAVQRLLPMFNLLFASIASLKGEQASFDDVFGILKLKPEILNPQGLYPGIEFSNSIALDKVSYSYEANGASALKGVSFRVNKGDKVAVVGPSGAGKSTLINVLLGFYWPVSGKLLVDGKPLERSDIAAWQAKCAYVPQKVRLINGTIAENVALGLEMENIDLGKVMSSLAFAGLTAFCDSLDQGIHSVVGDNGNNLSGGQQQRVGIARALYFEPEILILDEPTASVDKETAEHIAGSISNLPAECTVFVVSHGTEFKPKCNRILVLDAGQTSP